MIKVEENFLKKKLLVVFDIDDTLNSLMEQWLIYFNINNNTNFKYDQLMSNPPHEFLDISEEKYLNSLDKFREEKYLSLQPKQKILNWFKEYGDKFYFAGLTSVPRKFAGKSAFWTMKYFGNWIRSFNFSPSKREDQEDIRHNELKADWLYRNHADIFIDDDWNECVNACELGIVSYLIKQPWNDGFELEEILKKLSKEI